MASPTSVSVLVTAYNEPHTIARALKPIVAQASDVNAEIVVICPDEETEAAVRKFPAVAVLKDQGTGKPAAINLGLAHATGGIIVLTDGDVFIGPDAIGHLLAPFHDSSTGAVSGRPISLNPRNTMLGYWSQLLTNAGAHMERIRRQNRDQFLVCSGYLYAIRAGLVRAVPEGALAEDAVISQLVAEQGYRIRYAPDAQVFVHYPTTYQDWLLQRIRSTGGYVQPIIRDSPLNIRSFQQEALRGIGNAIAYPHSLQEGLWTLLLIAARLHLWLLVYWNVRIRRRPLSELWKRVESTKQGGSE